jgi:hypothetical protein
VYNQSILSEKFNVFASAFFLQFILLFPLSFLNDLQLKITDFIFGDFTRFLLNHFFNKKNIRIDYSSDSYSMLVLIIILLFTSVIFSFIIKKKWREYFLPIIEYICVIYISIILLKYGSDKIFRAQFPEPESNILFTRFGNLDQDILFWSTIGTSKIYNLIIGLIEFITGILLLLKRYQFLGILLAIISFSQIFIINIGFDISVKFFSLILLLMSFFVARKNLRSLISKIILLPNKTLSDQVAFLPYKFFLKVLILGILLIKIGLPHFNKEDENNSLNLAGVYLVTSSESPYKYLFFHKDQYLIFMEKSSEKMISFHYDISFDNQIILEDNQHHISKHLLAKKLKDSMITFSYKNQLINAKAINFKKMNVLQDRFHILTD